MWNLWVLLTVGTSGCLGLSRSADELSSGGSGC